MSSVNGLLKALAGIGLAIGGAWALKRLLSPEARDDVRDFVVSRVRYAAQVLGIAAPPVVESSDVPNAASDGVRILWNRQWVLRTLSAHCTDGWCQDEVVLGIVAHELAHHHLRHAARGDQDPRQSELDADFYAGFVLAAAGRGTERLEAVLFTQSYWPTPSHPEGHLRVVAIRQGREQAMAQRLGWAT